MFKKINLNKCNIITYNKKTKSIRSDKFLIENIMPVYDNKYVNFIDIEKICLYNDLEYMDFLDYMQGSTCPIVNNETMLFKIDVDRWLYNKFYKQKKD